MSKKNILIAIIVVVSLIVCYGIYQYLRSNLGKEKTMTVEVYFNNANLNPNSQDCNKVYPLDRKVIKTLGVAKASLEELFKGPTEEEKSQGYSSLFSQRTKDILKSVKVENNTAYVDLLDIRQVIPNASASCGSAQFLAEIETTLKQFGSVKKVIIAIDGKPSTFYEWIQMGCSQENDFCDETHFSSSSNNEQQAKNTVEEKAAETVLALRDKDAEKLSGIVHPEKGVRFSPYQHVDLTKDVVFSPAQVLYFFENETSYVWGNYDGSGEPIKLAPLGYYDQFIYDVDFSSAPEVGFNRAIGQGNIINNVFESYPDAIVVEYHFAGFDPQYEGMDWRSLELVFEQKDADWYLVGIIHGQWTI